MFRPSMNLFPMFNLLIATLGVLVFLLNSVVALSFGADKSVTIVPEASLSGAERKRVPIFWEWDGSRLIAHPSREEFLFSKDIDSFRSYKDTYAFIDEDIAGSWVADVIYALGTDQQDKYLVILIRPEGFTNFYNLRGYLEQRSIDIGYEPVDEEWKLRIRRTSTK